MKRLILLVLCVLPLTAPARADLADSLPPDTLAVMQWSGRSLYFDGSLLGQMLLDPDTRELFGSIRQILSDNAPMPPAQLAAGWELASIAWQRPIALAITDVDPQAMNTPAGPAGAISAVLLIDLGQDRESFQKQLDAILEPFAEQFQSAQVRQITVQQMATPAGPVRWGYIKDMFFLAFGENTVAQILDASAGKNLAASVTYRAAMKQVERKTTQLSFYLDVASLRSKIEQIELGPAATQPAGSQPVRTMTSAIAKAVGLDRTTTIAGATSIVDKGMYTRIRIASPAPHTGLLVPLAGEPLTPADLAALPADADYACVWNVSPKTLLDTIRSSVSQVVPGGARAIHSAMQQASEMAGFNVETDLIDTLGDTWTFSTAESQGGLLTGSVLSVEVKDAARLEKTLAALDTFIHNSTDGEMTVQTLKHEKMSIRCVEMNVSMFPMPILPSWTIHNGRLMVSLWPQTLIATANNPTQPLVETPQWTALAARLARNPSGVSYTNTPQIVRKAYPLILVLGTMARNGLAMQQPDTQTSLPLLPPAIHDLLKYFRPEMNAVSHDETGITIESYGSGLNSTLSAPVMTSLAVSALLPPLTRARSQAKAAMSGSNVNGLAKSCILYGVENGKYPASFDDMENMFFSGKMLVTPLSGNDPPRWDEQAKKWVGPIDYILIDYSRFTEAQIEEPYEMILIYEDPSCHDQEKIAVGFCDGHVQQMTRPQFQAALERTQKFLTSGKANN
jgi:hypothetical protein